MSSGTLAAHDAGSYLSPGESGRHDDSARVIRACDVDVLEQDCVNSHAVGERRVVHRARCPGWQDGATSLAAIE
jgi:hypothetical protein